MPRRLVALSLLLASLHSGFGQGRVLKAESVHSEHLAADRNIHIYLPASYEKEAARRYPVLYVHDGQNVFSTAGTNVAFGWGSWELDRTVDELSRTGKMQEIIMVAVNNSPARMTEYSGRSRVPGDPAQTNAPPVPTAFENYAAFLIQDLKPRIDREYRTQPEPAHTGVMGSSLGGICSLALAWQHPEVFGRAASLSGAFQVERRSFLDSVLKTYQGKPKPVRVYLDSGAVSFTGGDDGRALTEQVATELRRIGWTTNLLHYVDAQPLNEAEIEKTGLRRDKWNEAQTSQHNEFYWRLRAWRALTFLFPPQEK